MKRRRTLVTAASGRTPGALRRAQTALGLVFAAATVALWMFGARTEDNAHMQLVGDLPMSGSVAVGLVLLLMLLNALFVGAETAIALLRPMHVKHVREQEEGRGERLQHLIEHKAKYVAACTVGTHACRVGMVVTGFFLAPGVANLLEWKNGWQGRPSVLVAAVALIAIPIALLNLIFELVPRSYAELHPHRVGVSLYSFVRVFAPLLSLPAALVAALAGLVTSRFGGRASFGIENQAEEEIKNLAESAEETGEIESDEKELIHSVFEFNDTVAKEVMTPRVDLDAMPITSRVSQLINVIQKTGHTRIPIYEETDDQIVGIIHAKDLLRESLANGGDTPVRRLMRPALFIPENQSLHDLLREMRASRNHMAIVQDEFGGTSGIVTIEDIVEELIGDIVDEYDFEEPEIVPDGTGFLVQGKTDVDDVNDALGAQFDSDEFDTIGGYVFGLFGRQPKAGETLEADGHLFTVADTDGRRIVRLKIERLPEAVSSDHAE